MINLNTDHILSVVEALGLPLTMASQIRNAIKEKKDAKQVIDIFIHNLEIMDKNKLESNDYYIGNAFDDTFVWIETKYEKRTQIAENIEYLGLKLKPYLLQSKNIYLRKAVLKKYLEKPKMTDTWNFLNDIPNDDSLEIFWSIIKENKITEKIKFRNIDISKYQNKNRKFKDSKLNLKEKALCDRLYAHYQTRKSRTDFFEYVESTLPKLEIDYKIINEKLNPDWIYSQNFNNLPQHLKNKLNEGEYKVKINKKEYKFNLEQTIQFNIMVGGGNLLLTSGHFHTIEGKKLYTKKEYLNYFSNLATTKELLPIFLLNKADKAKSAANKSFWRYLHLELLSHTLPQKEQVKTKMKI